MTVTNEELARIRNSLLSRHDREVVSLASMMVFFWESSAPYGLARHFNMELLGDCIREVMTNRGISIEAFNAALLDVQRTNETISVLASLPD